MADYTFMDLYTEFVRLRQRGQSTKDAASQLQTYVDRLGAAERERLNQLVIAWEQKNMASKPRTPAPQSPSASPVSHTPRPSMTPTPQRTPPMPQQIKGIEPATKCPKCGRSVTQNDVYCASCGQPLRKKETRSLPADDPTANLTYFGKTSILLIFVRGTAQPFTSMVERETVLGRITPDSAMQPDIDFAPADAENLGVSRLHASVVREQDTLVIKDMNSKNHTYVNGQRLHPQEVRVLHDGDEIRLGRLPMKVQFRSAIKKLK
jgi:ribosomal protein L37E